MKPEEVAAIFKPFTVEAEYAFAKPLRRWRIDWFVVEPSIGFEMEGGVWMRKSRHTSPRGFIEDMKKYNAAQLMGITIYRESPERMPELMRLVKRRLDGEQGVKLVKAAYTRRALPKVRVKISRRRRPA